MAKIYSPTTWLDEVLATAERYSILEDGGGAFKSAMQILLTSTVTQAGTAVTAAKMNNLEDQVDADDDFLRAVATEKTVSGGVLTVDQSRHKIQPQTGTADDIDTISGIETDTFLILYVTDEGTDTLTFKHGTGNLSCFGAADIALSHGMVICYSDGTTVYVAGDGSGGGGGIANSSISPTTVDLTLTTNTRHFVDASGLTADRALKFPAASDGDQIEIVMVGEHISYACILQGDTGVDLEGLTATEWDRLWNTKMVVGFAYLTGDGWRLISDNRNGLIRRLELTGSATFDFQNIPQYYNNFKAKFSLRSDHSGPDTCALIFNNDTGNNYYRFKAILSHSAGYTSTEGLAVASLDMGVANGSSAVAGVFGSGFFEIEDYSNTNKYKDGQSRSNVQLTTASGNQRLYDFMIHWASAAAINRVSLSPVTGTNFLQYSSLALYGEY